MGVNARHVAYRAYQSGVGLAMRAVEPDQEMIFGPGTLLEIPGRLLEENVERVLVATTTGTMRRGTLDELLDKLDEAGIVPTVFCDVMPDPTDECAAKLAAMYRNFGCQAMVAVGGGSVMDCAKAAAVLVEKPGSSISQFAGMLKVRCRIPHIFAVPTTAGTGSEYTPCAVITDTSVVPHAKITIDDYCLVPRLAVLDPQLTLSLPPRTTAQSGMDALCHAVEAFINLKPSRLVAHHAVAAVRMIYANLPLAYLDGNDIEARGQMLLASYSAGIAFGNNMVGYVHAIAHGIGALYGVPHGEAVAIVLPYVLEQYGESAKKALAELARALGLDRELDAEEKDDDAELARRLIQSIRDLEAMLGIPTCVEGLCREDFDTIVDRAINEANPNYPVPQIWDRDEFEQVLTRLLPL